MSDKISPEEQIKIFAEIKRKDLEVRQHKIEKEYSKIQVEKNTKEELKKLSFFQTSDTYLATLSKASEQKFKNAEARMNFLGQVPELSAILPFYGGELFLLGARTGAGKTTCSANVAYSLILQNKKPVIILNEETADDYVNRVSALFLGTRYGNLEKIDPETRRKLNLMLPKVASKMVVIDADYAKQNGLNLERITNTVEGFEDILRRLLEEHQNTGQKFDAVIVDYYQRINISTSEPKATTWQVQERAAIAIESFRTKYPAPIVVFAQLHPDAKEDKKAFEDRMRGSRLINEFATCIMEIVTERKQSATRFVFHKGRNMDIPDEGIVCGWDSGKYVKYDEEFKEKILNRRLENLKKMEAQSDGPKRDDGDQGGDPSGD